MPSGGVKLDGGPATSEGDTSVLESDVSSVISISDNFVASDSEDGEDGLHDKQKYRLPDIGKTRLHLRTKKPLSPTPRQVPPSPGRQASETLPNTPHASQSAPSWQALAMQPIFARANGSSEHISDADVSNHRRSRPGSIYTLGRASLAGQLSHLTSLRLPDAETLAKRISSIPTSTEAAKALSDASEQIRIWIGKASEVLDGLRAEDDVEWAAAGGREGIEDVDQAINRFQNLVEVYVVSIERLQTRDDASALSAQELKTSVSQMEAIFTSWQEVKKTLKGVKEQVEIAMEWEELWNSALGEIGQEMEGLNRLVFEMEEKRHQGGSLLSSKDSIDISELETIVEERPGHGAPLHSHRFSMASFALSDPTETPPATENIKEESSLLALFARMQPVRASLEFLPMRLAAFRIRGNPIFPSACLDLDHRRNQLDELWKKLEADAESLRRELGEDRWVLVFRNAGRQALKMEESITRSFIKLKEAKESGEHQNNLPSFALKVESYEAKKIHYGPAIERVLAIIDRGVKDRLTVNGEILRLQSDMKQRWTALQEEMRDMDIVLEDLHNESRALRDSVSTVMSSERSVGSSLVDTPGSSPASSVVGTSRKSSLQGSRTPTPLMKTRRSSSKIPQSTPRRIPLTQSGEFTTTPSSSPLAPRPNFKVQVATRPEPPGSSRPRWCHSTHPGTRDFLPLSAFEPSVFAKTPVEKKSNFLRSSSNLSRSVASSIPARPAVAVRSFTTPHNSAAQRQPSTTPRPSLSQNQSHKSSLPVPATTPGRLTSRPSFANLQTPSQSASTQRSTVLPPPPKFTDGNDADTESPSHHKSRPPSALASGRRSSMLPRKASEAAASTGAQDERQTWRT